MAQDASIPQPIRVPRKWRWRVALVVVLLGAVFAGWWWFTRPKEMRLVDVVTPAVPGMPAGYSTSLSPASDHFILSSRELISTKDPRGRMRKSPRLRSIVRFRWDGEIEWQVHVPPPTFPSGSDPEQYHQKGIVANVSPNGRHCAVAVADGEFQQIIYWRDGRRIGAVRLPCRGVMARPTVLDSGEIYAWTPSEPTGSIYLIEEGRLKAQGKVAAAAGIGSWFAGKFSADGDVFVIGGWAGFEYHRVTVSGQTLKVTHVYTASESSDNPQLPLIMDATLLFAYNGAVYNDRGQVAEADGWRFSAYAPVTSTAIMQYQQIGKSPIDRRIRILDLRTRRHWSPSGGQNFMAIIVGEATPDGRFALDGRQPGRRLLPLAKKLTGHNRTPAFLKSPLQRFINRPDIDLILYERPGRARATLRITTDDRSDIPLPVIRYAGKTYRILRTVIARDGHTLRLICASLAGYDRKIFTYVW